MKRVVLVTALLLLATAASLAAHDLFLRPARFVVAPGSDVVVRVLNGTFSSSENAVSADRLLDLSLVGPSGRSAIDNTAWAARGDTTLLTVHTGGEGTYLVGASTRPRALRLQAKEFNAYLTEDGLPDVLAARRARGELGAPAHERYAKHVKTLIQAGATPGRGFDTVLGYPAELVPLANPYALHAGDTLALRALVDGAPVARQVVVAGGRTAAGARLREVRVRTDANGIARVPLRARGEWYVKFIHMVRVPHDTVDYESKWATLSFALR